MKKDIWTIQALRGLAASMVVLHHAIRAFDGKAQVGHFASASLFSDTPIWNFLVIGVDIFFVISGFIMMHTVSTDTGSAAARGFLVRRFIRIYPLYWIATLLPVLGALAVYLKSGNVDPFALAPGRLLASLTLFPSMAANGHVQPIVGVGWTLSYEVFFYLCFAAALVRGRQLALTISATLASIVLLFQFLAPGSAVVDFLAAPISLEFIYGMVLGALFKAGQLPRLPALVGFIALTATVAIAAVIPEEHPLRFICFGFPACLIVWSALSCHDVRPLKHATEIGAASYATYLFHMPVIYWLVLKPLDLLKVVPTQAFVVDALIVVAVLLSLLVGSAIHAALEKPLQHKLTSRLRKHQTASAVV